MPKHARFDRISKVLHARVPEKCLEGVGSWKGERLAGTEQSKAQRFGSLAMPCR